MSLPLGALALAAAIDGEAALRHAARLAALGPHPWGSPRAPVAADYVASQFREAGLAEVRLEEFESHGVRGANVVGVLRAPGREFVVVGAHHDTAPESPGAYDDGGGVGVVVEVARALARAPARPRTIVFASWDGEEAWATGKTTTAGSRAFVRALGPEARNMVAALAVEMCGWKGGAPVVHPIAYADPMRPGRSVIAPAWLLRASLEGARGAGAPLGLGDPYLSWLYQAGARTFRVRLYGDDLSFLQAGLPALFVSDSSFSAYYPWYHQATDTPDKLDAAALARMGQAVHGAVEALTRTPRGPGSEPTWFAVWGRVAGETPLMALGALSLLPGLVGAARSGGLALGARALQAALFALVLWRHPVPALWVFVLPNLATAAPPRAWRAALALLPAAALAALGAAAWRRGMVAGVWLSPWEAAAAGLAFLLLWLRPPRADAARRPARRAR